MKRGAGWQIDALRPRPVHTYVVGQDQNDGCHDPVLAAGAVRFLPLEGLVEQPHGVAVMVVGTKAHLLGGLEVKDVSCGKGQQRVAGTWIFRGDGGDLVTPVVAREKRSPGTEGVKI